MYESSPAGYLHSWPAFMARLLVWLGSRAPESGAGGGGDGLAG